MQKAPLNKINGWLNLYKPLGMSSNQAVGAVKRLLRPAKIGHAGTLDPLAEGILPLALGHATRTVSYMMDATKTYRFAIRFGARTSTDDREGEVVATSDTRPTAAQIEAILPRFTGAIEQVPPVYSAIRIEGERAYARARAGEIVEMRARHVMIHGLRLLSMPDTETAELEVVCGKGTYVRSLARDIAQALGSEGHVGLLIRERVGVFGLEDAISLDFLEKSVHKAPASAPEGLAWLKPVISVLDDIPAREVDGQGTAKLRTGQSLLWPEPLQGDVAVMHQGELVALCAAEGGMLKPKRVFNN